MFYLDKLIMNWVIKKCAELGGAFMLGPFEGAVIYASIFVLGLVQATDPNRGAKKGAKK